MSTATNQPAPQESPPPEPGSQTPTSEILPNASRESRAARDYFERVEGDVYTGPVYQQVIHEKSAASPPMEYPSPVEHFQDREHELTQVLRDLQPGRVVTLCGPGGIGKSALAAVAVHHLIAEQTPPERFPDGIIFYSFYGRPDVNLALEHIVTRFGLEPKPSPVIAAQDVLAGKRALLILDGTEEANNIQAVLNVRGTCGILLTTRTRSDAIADRQDLPPLQLDHALKLLRAWGGDRIQNDTAPYQICELVGRLPLAVRLVGRYLSETGETAAEYLEWLQNQPIDALDHGEHRERSVNVLLKRSVAQVSEDARQVLTVVGQLALVPFAIAPVATALDCDVRQCRSALGELVNYGLLIRPDDRYEVSHALVHSYARQRLDVESKIMERLVVYYASFAWEQQEHGREGYARLDAERMHIIHILERCQEQQQWQAISILVKVINTYLARQGYWTEQHVALKIYLHAAQQQGDRENEAWCKNNLGLICLHWGDYAAALQYLERSLAIRQAIDDKVGEGTTLNNIGQIYAARSDYASALQYLEQSLAIQQAVGDKAGEGTTLNNISQIYGDRGDYASALLYLERSLVIRQAIGDKAGEGRTLSNLAITAYAGGDYASALQYLEQGLAIQQAIGDKAGEGTTLNNISQIFKVRGDYASALHYLEQGLAIQQSIGDKAGEGTTLNNIGQIYAARSDYASALQYLEQGLAIKQAIGDKAGEAIICWNIGQIYLKEDNLVKVEKYFSRTVQIDQEIGHPNLEEDRAMLERIREQLHSDQG